MLFVGNQRGGARDLARHLMSRDNDHVEIHEMRGFASDRLDGAFMEAHAIAKGTKCSQFLYSLSVNPPPAKEASIADFEDAIDRAEARLGLKGQPRAIVFHEKNGRRHAHAVWSRIDADQMKAISMSHDRPKLQEVSKALYREHGWRMPDGMIDRSLKDPMNFSLSEWQQAKRSGDDPRDVKTALQDAWALSDSQGAFVNALEERGYALARGDQRGFVAVHRGGAVYALGKKWLGVGAKDVKARIGDDVKLPNVEAALKKNADAMRAALTRLDREAKAKAAGARARFAARKAKLTERQRDERRRQERAMETKRTEEARARQARFRSGLSGLWDKMRGEHKRIRERNEREAYEAHLRDRAQKEALIQQHLSERRRLDAFHARQEAHRGTIRDQLRDDRKQIGPDVGTASRRPVRRRRSVRRSQEPKLDR